MENTSKFVSQIGGVFIYSENPAELAEWYKKALDIRWEGSAEYNVWYATFHYNDIATGKKAYSVWSISGSKKRPKVEEKMYVINYRINNLEELVEHLKSLDIPVKDIQTHDEGKFTHIQDPDGNYIELWEDTKTEEEE